MTGQNGKGRMEMITLNSRVGLRAGLHTMDVDGATIIANENAGDSYGLELIARRIWQLLDHPATVSELCEILLQDYDIDRETCEQDVLDFLNDSAREGLIETAD
jgi:hypothetical protein